VFFAVLLWAASTGWSATTSVSQCRVETLEGEVRAGESFVQPIGNGLEVMLDPLASGWILHILPAGKSRPPHDYAELATPPYRSVSPLLISTDYSFRSQDAIGWNPRRFRFAPNEQSFRKMLNAYGEYEAKGPASTVAQQALANLVSRSPEGTLLFLDANLVPGTGDQVPAAAVVATRFTATAHTLEKPAGGVATVLGKLNWIRFRIAFEIPPGFAADRHLVLSKQPCSGP
jgi:hypothetical protein